MKIKVKVSNSYFCCKCGVEILYVVTMICIRLVFRYVGDNTINSNLVRVFSLVSFPLILTQV